MMSTVLEEVKRQCSMQTGEEYIFELIHIKKSECDQLTYILTTDVFYVQMFFYAVSRNLHILVIRLLFKAIPSGFLQFSLEF